MGMTNNFGHNLSPTENFDFYALNKQRMNREGTSYLEFQNFDDKEVELKDPSNTYNVDKLCISRGVTIKKLQIENNKLKDELKKSGVDLEYSRRTFEAVTEELNKQLDVAKKRESDGIAKTVGLRLENEKLHILLESKQSLVDKLKQELLNVKRALKVAIKDICTVSEVSEYLVADPEDSLRPQSRDSCDRDPRTHRVRFADSLNNSEPTE